jgi:hypothetical protein
MTTRATADRNRTRRGMGLHFIASTLRLKLKGPSVILKFRIHGPAVVACPWSVYLPRTAILPERSRPPSKQPWRTYGHDCLTKLLISPGDAMTTEAPALSRKTMATTAATCSSRSSTRRSGVSLAVGVLYPFVGILLSP